MISPAYVIAFIGAIVGLAIGMIVYGEIAPELECPAKQWLGTHATTADKVVTSTTEPSETGYTFTQIKNGHDECNRAITTGWTILGIFPVMFWFGFLAMFNRFAGGSQ